MKNQYTLSVSITTYNMEKYIVRAIESVLVQKVNFDYEIIVADDCSTDNTINILQKYQQEIGERFVIIYTEENKGVTNNFSKTLRQAKGKYIALLDADDYWINENKLQDQVDALDNNEEVGFVYTNFVYVDEITENKNNNKGEDYSKYSKQERFVSYLLYGNIVPSTVCIRTNKIDFIEIDDFIKHEFCVQDYTLLLSFLQRTQGIYIPKYTAVYLQRIGSLSKHKDVQKRIENIEHIYDIGNYFIEKYPIPTFVEALRNFNHKQKILLASWLSNDFDFVKQYSKDLKAKDFLRHNPKALYIYYASKNKFLYQLFKSWILRKRKTGE